MKKVKVGLIGAGYMGRNHARILSEESGFDFVGIYDPDSDRAGLVAKEFDAEVFETAEMLLESVEAVIIATPSSLHKDISLMAADRGVHALVEKPLATNSRDAREIQEVFDQKGLVLSVGHIERFNPSFKELQKIVDPAKVFFLEACRFSPYVSSGRITDTSVIEDLMIHDVDLICALMGDRKITSVQAKGEPVMSKRTDFATCVMDFDGKAHAVINSSRVSQNKERTIIVHTSEGCIRADLLTRTIEIQKSTNMIVNLTEDNSYKQDSIVQKVYVPIVEPLRAELDAFYNAVTGQGPNCVDGKVGVRAIEICEEVAGLISR